MNAIDQNKINTINFLSLDKLEYDEENPRLPNSLDRDFPSILDWMISKENIVDLMCSIGEKGFFPGEPILVISGKSEGKYVVIEGNRRYTASLLLGNPDIAPTRKNQIADVAKNAPIKAPTELPCLIFNNREEILDYLGYRHITGVEPWDSLAKARYLRQLSDRIGDHVDFHRKCAMLAKQIGSNVPYVRQLLLGVDLYDIIEENNYFGINSLDDKSFEFGTFYTGIIKPNVSRHINLNVESDTPTKDINVANLKEFTEWMFKENEEGQTRLGESRNLTKLNKILDPRYPKALETFRGGISLTIAAELTDEADDIVGNNLKKCQGYLSVAWTYFPLVKDYTRFNKEDIREMSRYLRQMFDILESKQKGDEEDFLS